MLEAKTCERSCASERGGGGSVMGGEAVGVAAVEGVGVGGECAVVETGREARRERSWVVRSVFWSSSDASWEWSVGAAGGTAGESGVAMVGRVCVAGGVLGEATGGRVSGGRARVPVFIYTAREALCCCWLGCTCRGFAADLT